MNPNAALGRLLPLLLPADRATSARVLNEVFEQTSWVNLACQRGLGACFKVFLTLAGYWDSIPPVVRDRLDAAYTENLAKCVLREQVLRELLPLVKKRKVQPVLLKGLAFANQLYPDPAARQAGDIDLLVEHSEKERADEAMQAAGFRLLSAPAARANVTKQSLRKAGSWLGFFRPVRRAQTVRTNPPAQPESVSDQGEAVYLTRIAGEDILIEIHYHMINLRAGGGKEEVYRSRAETFPATTDLDLPFGKVRVLDHEGAFLHALRHIALHHRLIGFRWHHDLALMLIRWEDRLDPIRIRQRCSELRSEKIFDVELALLEELFGPGILGDAARPAWRHRKLPWEYPLYRYVATNGKRTPFRELVRTLLAPTLREQLETLT